MGYRNDKPPSDPHYDKNTGKREPEHWHYQIIIGLQNTANGYLVNGNMVDQEKLQKNKQ